MKEIQTKNTSKTICFFNSTKAWGGGEKWHFEHAVGLLDKGYDVVFFTNKNSELYKKLSSEQVKVVRVSISNLSFINPFKILALRRKFIENSVDVIIMNLSADLKLAGFASKLAGVRRIIYRRGSAIPIKNKFLNRYIFKNILTDVLANTNATKETVVQNNETLFDRQKIKVIYNGIDLEKFDSIHSVIRQHEETPVIVIGNIGRLVEQKAQDHLIELAQILKAKNIKFKIRIGGTGVLESELKHKAHLLDVEEHVTFDGFIENPKEFLENIDIFVLTSKWEGFGYVLVEAGACRKPVIAYNISSNPEIISDGETGFLVNYGDLEALSEKIIALIENPVLRQVLGNNARKRVETLFTFSNSVDELEKYIFPQNSRLK